MMRVFRFIWALLKYLWYGDIVTHEEKTRRLRICISCPNRCDKKCCECGCNLNKKTEWSSERCPLKKW